MTYRHPSVFAAQAHHHRPRLARPPRAVARRGLVRQGAHRARHPVPVDRRTRFDLLEDALEIVTRLFTGEVVSYEGKVVSLHDAQLLPAARAAAAPADLDRRQRARSARCRSSPGTPTCGNWGTPNSLRGDERAPRRAGRRRPAATRRRSCGPARCRSTTSTPPASTPASGATPATATSCAAGRRRACADRAVRARGHARFSE